MDALLVDPLDVATVVEKKTDACMRSVQAGGRDVSQAPEPRAVTSDKADVRGCGTNCTLLYVDAPDVRNRRACGAPRLVQ